MVDVIDNFECEFPINSKVIITNGFYKNNYGNVINYDKKTLKYHIEITLNNSKKIIACNLNDIKTQKTLMGFMK